MKAIQTPNRFFSKNRIDAFSQIVANNSQQDFSSLFDNEKDDKGIISSSGNNIKFTINFFANTGEDILRQFDYVILEGINAGTIRINFIDINGDEQFLFALNGNAQRNVVLQMPSGTMSQYGVYGLTIELLELFDNSGIAQIRQARAVKFLCDLKATSETDIKTITDEGDLRSFNGKLYYWTNYEKWGCSIKAENISKAQYDLIKDALRKDGAITLIPYFDWDNNIIYEVYSSRKSIGSYSFSRWSGLISKTFEFEAV